MKRFTSVMAALATAFGFGASAQEATPVSQQIGEDLDRAEWREVDPENLFIFETTKGRVLIEAVPEVAPNHVTQFREIIRSGKYDGTAFHRVIDGFMAQGGDIEALHQEPSPFPNIMGEFTFRRDPAETPFDMIGTEGASTYGYYKGAPVRTQSKYLAQLTEDGRVDSWMPHCAGVVSTARTNDPNSANAQFFLLRDTSHHLDQQYTAWGHMVAGLDVVRSLRAGAEETNGVVTTPDILREARVAADLAPSERPRVWVGRTDAPEIRSRLAGLETGTDVCDLPQTPAIVEG